MEDSILETYQKKRMKWKPPNKKYDNQLEKELDLLNFMPRMNIELEKKVKQGESGWRNRYYTEVFGMNNRYDIDRLCHNYLEGLYWTFHYYNYGCISWDWCYRYQNSPSFHDIYLYMSKFISDINYTGITTIQFYVTDIGGLQSDIATVEVSVLATTIRYPITELALTQHLNNPEFLDSLRLGSSMDEVSIGVNVVNRGAGELYTIHVREGIDFDTVSEDEKQEINRLIFERVLSLPMDSTTLKRLGVVVKEIDHREGSHVISFSLETSLEPAPIKNKCICPPKPILDNSHTAYQLGQNASKIFTRINTGRHSRTRYTIPIHQTYRQNICNVSYDVNIDSCINLPDSSNIEFIDSVNCHHDSRVATANSSISSCNNGINQGININSNTYNNTNIKLDIDTNITITDGRLQQHIDNINQINRSKNQNIQNLRFGNQRVNRSLF